MLDTPAIEPAIWPSANEYGIPDLLPDMQADALASPLTTWGSVPRGTRMPGTWGFYTEDYRYTALWSDPRPVVRSGARAIIEPNFSCYEDMPLTVGLWAIYRKRWLARWWQSQGVRVLVDLNVAPKFADHNLLGVPDGWRAYATRGYINRLDQTQREYETACNRAGAGRLLFVVYGGSRKLRDVCAARGWTWAAECMDVRKDTKIASRTRAMEVAA